MPIRCRRQRSELLVEVVLHGDLHEADHHEEALPLPMGRCRSSRQVGRICGRRRSLAASCRRGATAWALPETAKPSVSAERSNDARDVTRLSDLGMAMRWPASSVRGVTPANRRTCRMNGGSPSSRKDRDGRGARICWDQATPNAACRRCRWKGIGARAYRRIGIVWSVRHPTGARRVHPLADRLVRVGRNHIPSRGERTGGSELATSHSPRITCVCTPAFHGEGSLRAPRCGWPSSIVTPLAGSVSPLAMLSDRPKVR